MDVTIRKMRKSDIPFLTAIVDSIYLGTEDKQTRDQAKKDLPDAFSNANIRPTFFVAMNGKERVGFIGMEEAKISFNAYDIFWLMVKPEHHLKKVGTQLMRHVISEAKEKGAKYLRLAGYNGRYFKQFGFKKCAKFEDNTVMHMKIK